MVPRNPSMVRRSPWFGEVHPWFREVHPSFHEVHPWFREVHASAKSIPRSTKSIHASAKSIVTQSNRYAKHIVTRSPSLREAHIVTSLRGAHQATVMRSPTTNTSSQWAADLLHGARYVSSADCMRRRGPLSLIPRYLANNCVACQFGPLGICSMSMLHRDVR